MLNPEAPLLRSMSNRCIHVYEVQGKVVAEEIPLEAIPAYTGPCERT